MRLRRSVKMPPEAARQLRALDAALAGEPVDGLPELRDLAVDLQADRPVPAAEFVRALDARAAAGFPKPPARTPSRPARRRGLPLALGTASAVFILVTVGLTSGLLSGGGGGGGQSTGGPPTKAAPLRQPSASPDAATGQAQALPSRPAPALLGVPSGTPVRKVERAATIALSAPRDEIETVSDGVIHTADRYGGFVLSSRVSSGDQGAGATIDLRIPSSRLQSAIADLSKLAHVRARSQSALDITDRFAAPRRALADATAERRALLTQLAHAVTPNETASIRARLKLANDRINVARATLRRLANRVGYSAVSVTVEPGAPAAGGSWSVGDAFGDALGVLGVAAGVLVITLAVLVPVTVLLALAWAGRRAYLRRARNGALSAVEKPATR